MDIDFAKVEARLLAHSMGTDQSAAARYAEAMTRPDPGKSEVLRMMYGRANTGRIPYRPTEAERADAVEKRTRDKFSCPTCKATPGMWCRKMPDSTDTVAYHGRRWGQRRRVRCHEARHDKRILCEGLS